MPPAVRRPARDRRGRDQPPQGPHVPDRGRRPRAASGHLGSRRVRRGRVRPVLQGVDARTARIHQGRHRRRDPLDRPVHRPVVPGRRTRARTRLADIVSWMTDALDGIRKHGPEGRLYRSWQLKELLRTLLKHPLEQARGELRRWVFLASHSRMPEIVELAKRIRGGADRTSSAHHRAGLLERRGSRRSTTGSRSPSAWPTASAA